ncbi:polysialyltransferase family glycosyltransferase [Shivajiella indica]|uniref:Polysialyltransferase family glycosyltransferase n=1 Tax=Shivajiella indica TaxID=872115 RepID=A0ABW5BBJ5_9BACT
MRKNNIVVFVHTEYHLMLTINEILKNPEVKYRVYLIKKGQQKRLSLALDLTGLPNATFLELILNIDLKQKFTSDHVGLINELITNNFNELIFFQEQDPFILSILKSLKKNGIKTEISLYQDGLKPYNQMKGFSIGMIQGDIKVWKWLWKNNIKELKPYKLLQTKRYAYLDEIDSVFLTFPESYYNWNKREINQIQFFDHLLFKSNLEKVFDWNKGLLPKNENVIFYLTQPMHHDANVEVEFLEKLQQRLGKEIILKLHPLTNAAQEKVYRSIGKDVYLIKSKIPAELFIMNLKDSTIVSLNSTSLFYPSPSNRYYYTSNLFQDKIKRLTRYKFNSSPASHIKMVKSLEEIV